MSPPDKDTDKDTKKPKLNRQILQDQQVFFYDHVHDHNSERFPDWLRSVCSHMRRTRTKLPRGNRRKLEAELVGFERFGQDGNTALAAGWSLTPTEYSARVSFTKESSAAEIEIERALDDCLRVKKLAIKMCRRREEEAHWVTLLRTELFKTYIEVHDTEDEYRYLFDRWELHVDVLWNECLSRKISKSEERTEPKPDFTYSFPIIDPASNMAQQHCFDPTVDNFTLPVLSQLRKRRSIISSPVTTLLNCDPRRPGTLGAQDLACFPWAIVEVKPNNVSAAEFCYCQAANGSAEALVIRENLAKKASHPSNDALVIFSFTCVGPSVRFWLTFRNPTNHNIEMCCIWATSLELTWGIFALRMMIKNMREFVYDRVKPEICRWISHVRVNPEPHIATTLNGDQLEQRRRARSPGPEPEEKPLVSRTPPPRPASTPNITSKVHSKNTVPRSAQSSSPLGSASVPPRPASTPVLTSHVQGKNTVPRSAHPSSPLGSPSVPPRPASTSRITSNVQSKNTVPRSAHSPSPLGSAAVQRRAASTSKIASKVQSKNTVPTCARSASPLSRRSTRRPTPSEKVKYDTDEVESDQDEANHKNYCAHDSDGDENYVPSDGSDVDELDEGYLSGRGHKVSKLKLQGRKINRH